MKNFRLDLFLKSRLGIIVVLVVLLLAGIPGFYYFQKYQSAQKELSSATGAEIEEIVKKVGALMVLPTDEEPTLATVSDVTKLEEEPFFKNAKNGDKVLVYAKNSKAILYRPSVNKVVEVAPINLGSSQVQEEQQQASAEATPKQLTVTVYNGSDTVGLASSTKTKIEGKFANIKVNGTANAAGEHSETSVYDLTGKNKATADELAKFLGGKVASSLSSAEEKPSTDFLVIVVE